MVRKLHTGGWRSCLPWINQVAGGDDWLAERWLTLDSLCLVAETLL